MAILFDFKKQRNDQIELELLEFRRIYGPLYDENIM